MRKISYLAATEPDQSVSCAVFHPEQPLHMSLHIPKLYEHLLKFNMIHHLKLDRGNALMRLSTADMPAWFQNMNQNSGAAPLVARSSQRGGDVDVSAKESCCQSSVSWSNVVQSPETLLWCMSSDSFLTQRILPAYNKMSHVKFVKPAVNSSKI